MVFKVDPFAQVGRPAIDIVRHFIQRWNYIKKIKAEGRAKYPLLIAKSDEQNNREHPPQLRSYFYNSGEVSCHPDKGTCKVQIVRSVSKWSHGLDEIEVNLIFEFLFFFWIIYNRT